jgi:predicted Zn-dependent protease
VSDAAPLPDGGARRWTVLVVVLAATVAATWLLVASHEEEQEIGLESLVTLVGTAERAARTPLARAVRLSDEDEEAIGEQVARMAGFAPASEPELQAYVAAVGASLAEHRRRRRVRYRFFLTENDLANAWALPGGRVYVTTGLLRLVRDEAELAAVLGHEIAHVDLRHCGDRIVLSKRAGQLLGEVGRISAELLHALTAPSYSEEQELEADAIGARLAARAGYDPEAARDLFQQLALLEALRAAASDPRDGEPLDPRRLAARALERYFASHPPAGDRRRALRPVVKEILAETPDSPRYRGARNLRERTPFGVRDWPDEYAAELPRLTADG